MRLGKAVAILERTLAGAAFPAFLLAALGFGLVLAVVMLAVPAEGTALSEFAEDFRVWCFSYDPRTGEMEWAYVVGMTTSPLLLGAVTLLLWWTPLAAAWREGWRRLVGPAVPALALVAAVTAGIALTGSPAEAALAFPAEELRTAVPAPDFTLTDHLGEEVSLAELRGRVVVVTGVYAHCVQTCPMILLQAKSVLAELTPEERAAVTVVAVTLDPERDRPAELAALGLRNGVHAPSFRLATGDPAVVARTLDAYGISRRRDGQSGVIDHANLFVVIDRDGRIAYRFSLGGLQQDWLARALRLLVAEDAR